MTTRERACYVLAGLALIGFLLNAASLAAQVLKHEFAWAAAAAVGGASCWVVMRFSWDAARMYKEERS